MNARMVASSSNSNHQPNLHVVDWSKIPAPIDDGAAAHLTGRSFPPVKLAGTDGVDYQLDATICDNNGNDVVSTGNMKRTVVFCYPRTAVPDQPSLVDDWDAIPGARGCTPQSCRFRDLYHDLLQAGATSVFGLSTQSTDYQREARDRLHLPYELLSDESLTLTKALSLPTMDVAGTTLIKRLAMIVDNGTIVKVFYPVFPPDENAADVLEWLQNNPYSISSSSSTSSSVDK